MIRLICLLLLLNINTDLPLKSDWTTMTLTWKMKVRLFWPMIGILSGIMAGLSFTIIYHNWSAAVMAFISSISAVNLLLIHRRHIMGTMLMLSESKVKFIFAINCILSILCFVGVIVCLTLAATWHQSLSPKDLKKENLWITAVWFFMTFKWFILSVWYIHRYTSQQSTEQLLS
ncbi:unnamed protein product [Litomosoides sigmodontis]|uniref:Heme-copper oxidase subunit III family profile domain-containing protein n=1 Tax=Litomosoides sigmodontis TaxID=42156 RepID=A0A3P6UCK6_LITSI|nr:unnamed protein product [Litomosoides sigmodontis]